MQNKVRVVYSAVKLSLFGAVMFPWLKRFLSPSARDHFARAEVPIYKSNTNHAFMQTATRMGWFTLFLFL